MSSHRRLRRSLRLAGIALVAPLAGCFLYGLPPDPPVVESALLRQFIREHTDRETGERRVTLRLPLTPNDTLVARFVQPWNNPGRVDSVEVVGAPQVVVNDSLTLGYEAGTRMKPQTLMQVMDAQRIVVHIPKPRYDTRHVRLDVTQRAVFRAFVARMSGTAWRDLTKVISR